MLAKDIIGKEVFGSEGIRLGKVTDLEVDQKSWQVKAIEVELEKDVAEQHNLRRRFRRTNVLVNNEHIQAVGDSVILKGSNAELLKLLASSTPYSGPSTSAPSNGKGQQQPTP